MLNNAIQTSSFFYINIYAKHSEQIIESLLKILRKHKC